MYTRSTQVSENTPRGNISTEQVRQKLDSLEMVRMFLGTQILFAMSHTKVGLLSKDPVIKAWLLEGGLRCGAGEGWEKGNKQETSNDIINYFSSNSLKTIKLFSLPFYLISFPFPPNTSENEPPFSEKKSKKGKRLSPVLADPKMPTIHCLCLVSLRKIIST